MPFMTHTEHGANNVPEHEVSAHEKNGWKVDTFENWLAHKPGNNPAAIEPKVDAVEQPETDELTADELARNKPGRKPKAR